MAGIGVVINPHARANRRAPGDRLARMTEIIGADGLVRVTESLDALDVVAREFHERQIDILAICGGDGSDHCTLTALHRAYGHEPLPMLLPLRAGTINYVAEATGGRRGSPEQVLARVVSDHRRGHRHVTTERDLLRVNGSELGFVLSFGTTVNFLQAYYGLEAKGPGPAARLLGRTIVSALAGTHLYRTIFEAVEADIECDVEVLPHRLFTFFFAATLDQIALGFQPTYMGSRKRGFFHVIGGQVTARRLISRIVRVWRGFPTGLPEMYDNLGQNLTIRFARPTAYMLDGDILPATDRLEVDVPVRVRLIRN